jgi:hypothetical protein
MALGMMVFEEHNHHDGNKSIIDNQLPFSNHHFMVFEEHSKS